ncbi:OmpA/MotB family protein [Motiliproteus sediminis]|uniref:OmpA/MotB family protein n=1 Tax=Motiliproteus sediminis TaxID=1468178 RepID=UPI001AEFB82D|nr:OmpA family protein [Motiliproteus sediminis]
MTSKATTAARIRRINKVRSALGQGSISAQQGYFTERPVMVIGLVCVTLLMLSGCVSSAKYEQMVSERDALLEQQAQLNSQVAQTEEEKAAAAKRAKEAFAEAERQKQLAAEKEAQIQAELVRQQEVYDNLQSTFAKEQEANQVKIEMIKSGIKVNLANEILFASGSAQLNEQGVEVLTRAAAELKKSPYQTVVAGFTDNVAISGGLASKYPTNWELAAARASSVVRLLEQEGVSPDQLLAISFGEHNPVADNDSDEGRAKNRRIEIIQRPVPVSTN